MPTLEDTPEAIREYFARPFQVDEATWVHGVRIQGDEAIVLVRIVRNPWTFGIPLSLADTSHGPYRRHEPTPTLDRWLADVALWLMAGMSHSGERIQRDEYIEVRPRYWPNDERFGCLVASDGRSVTGVTASEACSGGLVVGQATTSWKSPGVARLLELEVLRGVPRTVVLQLAWAACHSVADYGAREIRTSIVEPELALLGFSEDQGSERVVATSFVNQDFDGASALLRRVLRRPEVWGVPRDQAGRQLPSTRLGRLRHRREFGPSGAEVVSLITGQVPEYLRETEQPGSSGAPRTPQQPG